MYIIITFRDTEDIEVIATDQMTDFKDGMFIVAERQGDLRKFPVDRIKEIKERV